MSHHIRIASVDDSTNACTVLRQSITECCIQDHRNDLALIDAWLRNKTAENVAAWIDNPLSDSVVATAQSEVIGFALSQRGVSVLRLDSTLTASAFYRRNGFASTSPTRSIFGMPALPMSKALFPTS